MKFVNRWQNFWFAPMDLAGAALARMALGLTLFFTYLGRFENLNLLTSEALLPRGQAMLLLPENMRPLWLWTFWPDSWALAVHSVFCLALLLWVFGIGGRVLGILVWVLHMGFIQRNYAIVFGADVMAAVFLFYLVLIQTPAQIKNMAMFRQGKDFFSEDHSRSDILSSVMIRLLQIQMGIIYAYTGFEKLKGTTWWDGTALWSIFANPQMVWLDMTFVRNFAWVLPVMAFSTIVFEIYFPAAMLSSKLKNYWLAAGLTFHLGIAFLMSLWSFSFVMLAIYFVYIDPLDLRRFSLKIRQKLRRTAKNQTF